MFLSISFEAFAVYKANWKVLRSSDVAKYNYINTLSLIAPILNVVCIRTHKSDLILKSKSV